MLQEKSLLNEKQISLRVPDSVWVKFDLLNALAEFWSKISLKLHFILINKTTPTSVAVQLTACFAYRFYQIWKFTGAVATSCQICRKTHHSSMQNTCLSMDVQCPRLVLDKNTSNNSCQLFWKYSNICFTQYCDQTDFCF